MTRRRLWIAMAIVLVAIGAALGHIEETADKTQRRVGARRPTSGDEERADDAAAAIAAATARVGELIAGEPRSGAGLHLAGDGAEGNEEGWLELDEDGGTTAS